MVKTDDFRLKLVERTGGPDWEALGTLRKSVLEAGPGGNRPCEVLQDLTVFKTIGFVSPVAVKDWPQDLVLGSPRSGSWF